VRISTLLLVSCAELIAWLSFGGRCSEVAVVFKNVSKQVPALGAKPSNPPEMKQILFDVSGCIKPGEVVALMVSSPHTPNR
jgi:hypothetical protein